MARVFIIEPTRLDTSAAADFGAIRYLFCPGDQRCSIWDEEFASQVLAKLRLHAYDPLADYLVVAGHTVAVAQCIAICICEFKRLNVLFFSATHRNYVSRTLGAVPCSKNSKPSTTS